MYDSGWWPQANYDQQESWRHEEETRNRDRDGRAPISKGIWDSDADYIIEFVLRELKWPVFGPSCVAIYLWRKFNLPRLGIDFAKCWICRTKFFEFTVGLLILIVGMTFSIWTFKNP